MGKNRSHLWTVSLIATSCFAGGIAQKGDPPDTYNHKYVFDRNGQGEVQISTFEVAGTKVTGTCIEFSAGAGATTRRNYPGPLPRWDYGFIKTGTLKLTINGEEIPIVFPSPPEIFGKKLRIDSTHFSSSESGQGPISIKIEATFRFERYSDPPNNTTVAEFVEKPLSVTVDTTAWNKALFLATDERWWPKKPANAPYPDSAYNPNAAPPAYPDGEWEVGDTPANLEKYWGNAPKIARDAIAAALGALASANHKREPSTATAAQSLTRADILPKFLDSTAFFTVTHGAEEGLRASKPASGAAMTDSRMFFIPDIENAVKNGRFAYIQNKILDPAYSSNGYGVVMLVACNACADRYTAAKAFGIGNGTSQGMTSVKNQALVGFTFPVSAMNVKKLVGWVKAFTDSRPKERRSL